MYFCGFLTMPISDVLSEKGLMFFVMYHSNVILGVATWASNSELIPKRFLFKVISLCDDCKKMHKLLD